jgi:hypothetical protein
VFAGNLIPPGAEPIAANSSGSQPSVWMPSSEASDSLNLIKWGFATGVGESRAKKCSGKRAYVFEKTAIGLTARSAIRGFSIDSLTGMRRKSPFEGTLSIARH